MQNEHFSIKIKIKIMQSHSRMSNKAIKHPSSASHENEIKGYYKSWN